MNELDSHLFVGFATCGSEVRCIHSRRAEETAPEPPPGDEQHRCFFTVSALDVDILDIPAGATPAVLGFRLRGRIVRRAQLMGTARTPANAHD